MKRTSTSIVASFALGLLTTAIAYASDVDEGAELYISQCKICHGSLSEDETASRMPRSTRGSIQVAMLESVTGGTTDAAPLLVPELDSSANARLALAGGDQIAFAPPYGPNLRGVIGRPAGTVEGYAYSKTMLKSLKGMEWTEASLNVWITNPQAWVPGVYMYYKQEDPEIRRKIIQYLKANP